MVFEEQPGYTGSVRMSYDWPDHCQKCISWLHHTNTCQPSWQNDAGSVRDYSSQQVRLLSIDSVKRKRKYSKPLSRHRIFKTKIIELFCIKMKIYYISELGSLLDAILRLAYCIPKDTISSNNGIPPSGVGYCRLSSWSLLDRTAAKNLTNSLTSSVRSLYSYVKSPYTLQRPDRRWNSSSLLDSWQRYSPSVWRNLLSFR